MSHYQIYSQWIDSCPNKIKFKETNKLCLQVAYDFLTKVAIEDQTYDQSRQHCNKRILSHNRIQYCF